MSDESTPTEGSAGLGRRDFIRSSAIVGGMVWAAPAMSTLGSRAFADNGSPPDPNGELVCDRWFQFKISGFEGGDPGFEACATDPDRPANQCYPEDWNFDWESDPEYYCIQKGTWNLDTKTFTIDLPSGRSATLKLDEDYKGATLTVPSGCKILGGDAKAASEQAGGGCYDFVNGSPQTYTVDTGQFAISNVNIVICCED